VALTASQDQVEKQRQLYRKLRRKPGERGCWGPHWELSTQAPRNAARRREPAAGGVRPPTPSGGHRSPARQCTGLHSYL